MSRSRKGGAVDVLWYLPGKKRRLAVSSQATSDLITFLAEDRTWLEVLAAINYDNEAERIAQTFIDAGYGNNLASPFLVRRTQDPGDQHVALSPRSLQLLMTGQRPSGTPEPLAERTVRMTIRDLAALIGEALCQQSSSASTPPTTMDAA